MIRFLTSAFAVTFLAAATARADTPAAPAGDAPVLVELFTSEGCSSCPPADALLAQLASAQPVAGAHVIALGEHVDYWDDLGWRDRFATSDFTERERDYAKEISGAGIYTPEMVIDGRYALVGSDRGGALRAIALSAAKAKLPVSLAWTEGVPQRLHVHVASAPGGATVWLATTQSGVESKVRHGENGGLTLNHVGLARSLRPIGEPSADGGFERTLEIEWPATPPAASRSVVVFVQDGASGRILGSAELCG